MKRKTNRQILIGFPLMAALLAPLLAWAYIGLFTRYWFDDFCYTSVLHKLGFLRSQAYWYQHWTGRYSFIFSNTTLESIGPWLARFLPAVLLLIWLAVGVWTFYQLLSLTRLPCALISSVLLAELIIFATLNSAPDIVASFYWQTGLLVYSAPLVALTLSVGLLAYGAKKSSQPRIGWPLPVATALLTFVAGGLSEVYGAVQIVGLSLFILLCLRYASGPFRRALLLLSLAGLVGSLVSFGILALAPGHELRAGNFPPHPQLFQLIKSSFSYPLTFMERHVRRSRGTAFLTLVFPMWLAFMLSLGKPNGLPSPTAEANRKRLVPLLILAPLAVYLMLAACFAPGYYALSDALPGRAQIIPKFILIFFTVLWTFTASLSIFQRVKESAGIRNSLLVVSSGAVLALTVLSPLASARHTFGLRLKASQAAQAWDDHDKSIRLDTQQRAKAIVLPATNLNEWELGWGRSDLLPGADPNAPQNRCLADYYGLETITFK